MKCVVCGGRTTVTSTYQNESGLTKRRRQCYECKFRFTTRERPEQEGVELAQGWINRDRLERADRKPRNEAED